MKLDLYAGKKRVMTFVQWHPVDPVTQHILAKKHDCYAIPGGNKASEQTIRDWAKEYGFYLKKIYEVDDATLPDA